MLSHFSRAVGAATVLGFFFYGFKTAAGNVLDWKHEHDAAIRQQRTTVIN